MNHIETIDAMLLKLLTSRKKLCYYKPVPVLKNGDLNGREWLCCDHPDKVSSIDDEIERIEPLREIIKTQMRFIQSCVNPLEIEASQRLIATALDEAKKRPANASAVDREKLTESQERQIKLIELIRSLMISESGSGAWPAQKKGREGFLKFIWRKHQSVITRLYGLVDYSTIRRKTTPSDCTKLNLPNLPLLTDDRTE